MHKILSKLDLKLHKILSKQYYLAILVTYVFRLFTTPLPDCPNAFARLAECVFVIRCIWAVLYIVGLTVKHQLTRSMQRLSWRDINFELLYTLIFIFASNFLVSLFCSLC